MTVLMHLSDLHFGAHDPLACAAVQRLAQRLGVPLSRVPAAGHNLPVDRPEQAVTALRKALGDNLQGS